MTSGAETTNKKPATARKKFPVRALLVLLACGAALILFRPREPRYNGRSLTSWLQQYSDTWNLDANQSAEARNAICSIGTQRSLPTLLKLITAKDSIVSGRVFKIKAKLGLHFLHWRYAAVSQLYGMAGFQALGTNAGPAVDALTKLLNDKDGAIVAFQCLERIGKPAEGAFCQCLTNQDWRVRILSVGQLASVTDDVETYLSRVKVCLNDTNDTVRVTAVRAIGQRTNAPDLALPILREALNSTDEVLAAVSAQAIGNFGTNGASAFSSLTNLIASGRPGLATSAMYALAAVAPTRAVPILSNTVVNGGLSLSYAALRILRPIAPELCAQMTLAQLRSPDPLRRLKAVNLRNEEIGYLNRVWISQYPDCRKQFISSLTTLLNDPDQDVRMGATNTLKELDPQAAAQAGIK